MLSTEISKNVSLTENNELPAEKDKLYSRLQLEVRGIDPAVLTSYSWFATTAAQHLGINVGKWLEYFNLYPSHRNR